MCGSMVDKLDIQSSAAEIRRGIKKERMKPQGKNIMACPPALLHWAAIKKINDVCPPFYLGGVLWTRCRMSI